MVIPEAHLIRDSLTTVSRQLLSLAMEQDGVGMKHSTGAAHQRVAQGGLLRNGRICRIAYRKCLKRKRRRKLPLFGLRCLAFIAKDFAYIVQEMRRQARFLHDKIASERTNAGNMLLLRQGSWDVDVLD